MSRNIRTEAIVLKTGRVGEIHKSVNLLTRDLGLVEAIAHGVYKGKGKLAGITDPFARSTTYLYFEPVKRNYKITDMEPLELYESLRLDLDRYYAASLWAEVIIRSHAGGEGGERVYQLLRTALTALDSPLDTERTQIQFLWRFIALSGFLPDIVSCAICGREFAERAVAFYRQAEGDFACSACVRVSWEGEGSKTAVFDLPELSAGARKYLIRTGELSFDDAMKIDLEHKAKEQLRRLVYRFVQDILEVPLKTLQAGVL